MAKGNFIEYVVSDNPNKYPNESEQDGYYYRKVEDVETEEKTVTAGTSVITVSPTNGKVINKVIVNPTPSQSKSVTPGRSGFTVNPDSGKLLSSVYINGDSDLIPTNIKQGINIFGINGTLTEGKSGIDFGTINVSSNSSEVTVSHNLGSIPSWAALIPTDYRSFNNYSMCNINGLCFYINNYVDNQCGGLITLTSTSITFKANPSPPLPFVDNDYYWIAIS